MPSYNDIIAVPSNQWRWMQCRRRLVRSRIRRTLSGTGDQTNRVAVAAAAAVAVPPKREARRRSGQTDRAARLLYYVILYNILETIYNYNNNNNNTNGKIKITIYYYANCVYSLYCRRRFARYICARRFANKSYWLEAIGIREYTRFCVIHFSFSRHRYYHGITNKMYLFDRWYSATTLHIIVYGVQDCSTGKYEFEFQNYSEPTFCSP